jgi:glycerol-3-phosphate dehydrogenase
MMVLLAFVVMCVSFHGATGIGDLILTLTAGRGRTLAKHFVEANGDYYYISFLLL